MTQPACEQERPLAPFLKWAGGKRWLVGNWPNIFPERFNRYIEPFLGSGAVFFHLHPKRALLSDLNEDLINTYEVMRDDWRALGNALGHLQERHSDQYFYIARAWKPVNPIERAARFLYLNRTCWNGLYRVNRKGEFNVPRGTKNTVILPGDDFERISRRLEKVSLQAIDFESSIDSACAGDLVFVDPPYTVKHNLNGFIKYNDNIFSWSDQIRLRDSLLRADLRGVQVIMTNANHASIRALYKGFKLRPLRRQTVLSGSVDGRGATEELLVTNLRK